MDTAAPFHPAFSGPTRYSMAGDDCSLHFELARLTPRQQQDHRENQLLTAMLQIALLYIAGPADEVSLYDRFAEAPWRDAVERYRSQFLRMGLDPLPLERTRFHPMEGFYESVAERPFANDTLYMTSGSNQPLHHSAAALEISRNLNSKLHFASHAPTAGIPTPATLKTRKGDLSSKTVSAFFESHLPRSQGAAPPALMLKIQGLAGSRNVTRVQTVADAEHYLQEFPDSLELILQEQLPTADYAEMTVDLRISDREVEITNVRELLFANGLWVGNRLGPGVSLSADERAALLRVGQYAIDHGYSHRFGLNLGIDYFVRRASAPTRLPPLLVTELNARWTGGLFPAELIKRLGAQAQDAVAFIDLCPADAFAEYQAFVDAELYQPGKQQSFALAPMGFCPYPVTVNERDHLYLWQVVLGDFAAFKAARSEQLDAAVLPTVPSIEVPAVEQPRGAKPASKTG